MIVLTINKSVNRYTAIQVWDELGCELVAYEDDGKLIALIHGVVPIELSVNRPYKGFYVRLNADLSVELGCPSTFDGYISNVLVYWCGGQYYYESNYVDGSWTSHPMCNTPPPRVVGLDRVLSPVVMVE